MLKKPIYNFKDLEKYKKLISEKITNIFLFEFSKTLLLWKNL